MTPRNRLCWLPCLVAVLVCAGPQPAAAADKEAELAGLKERIGRLQRDMQQDLSRRDRLAAALRDAEREVAAARSRLDRATRELALTDGRLEALAGQQAETRRALATQRRALAGALRAAYLAGREEHLKLLLSQRDPARLGRLFTYYGYLGRARAGAIEGIEASLVRLAELEEQLTEERILRAGQQSLRERELLALEEARGQRKQALGAMNARIGSNQAALAGLRREAQALEKLLEALRRETAGGSAPAGQPFARVKGRLPWPVKGRVTANFGQSRGGGLRWNGIAIAADRGTAVSAPYAGKVVYSDWLPGLGLLLIIDHGGGYMTLYGHNEQLYKAVGEAVSAGETIATVGDSGGRGRPELYLEVRRGKVPEDPRRWFRGSPR
ncbi:MAG: murein hydrolase activator EnvC family protein [Steroidobacteraceae bacterium]